MALLDSGEQVVLDDLLHWVWLLGGCQRIARCNSWGLVAEHLGVHHRLGPKLQQLFVSELLHLEAARGAKGSCTLAQQAAHAGPGARHYPGEHAPAAAAAAYCSSERPPVAYPVQPWAAPPPREHAHQAEGMYWRG
jgi:hypothetical protein